MWCSTCQQDVASAAPAADTQPLRCERCRQELAGSQATASGTAVSIPATLPLADDWELEADLRSVERMILAFKKHPSSSESALANDTAPNGIRTATARHAPHD